jgi:hypothetical protein
MVTIASIWNHHVYVSIYFLPICLGNSKNWFTIYVYHRLRFGLCAVLL